MHSRTSSRRARRGPFVLGVVLASVAVACLGLTIMVLVARAEVTAKLEALGRKYGLRVTVGDVDLPLAGGIGAAAVAIYRADGTVVAHFDRVETDLGLIEAALGKRRPSHIRVIGGEVVVRVANGKLADFATTGADEADAGNPSAKAAEIELELAGVSVGIEARHATARGAFVLPRTVIRAAEGSVTRDASRHWRGVGHGMIDTTEGPRHGSLKFDLGRGEVALDFGDGVRVVVETPRGPASVRLGGVTRAAADERLEVRAFEVQLGDRASLALAALTVEGGGTDLVPSPRGLTSLSMKGVEARQELPSADGRRFATHEFGAGKRFALFARELRVALGEPAEVPAGLPGGDGGGGTGLVVAWPVGVVLEDVHVASNAGAGRFEGEARHVELTLSNVAARLADGHLIDAVTALKMARPRGTLLVPARRDESGEAGDAPKTVADEPFGIIANDEEPHTPTQNAAAADAPAWGWLDRLFDALPSPEGLLPESLRARWPVVVARLEALKPEIRDAGIEVRDANGKQLLALEEGELKVTDGASGADGAPGAGAERAVVVAFRGAVLRDGRETGRVDVTANLTEAGTVRAVDAQLSGRDLANRIGRFIPHLSVQPDSELDLRIRYERPTLPNAPHHIAGSAKVRHFSFEFWRIADREIKDLEGEVSFEATLDGAGRRLLLSLPEMRIGDATLSGSIDIRKPAKHVPAFTARLAMARQDCGKAAASIPKALVSNLTQLAFRGEMEFAASLTVDLAKPQELDLEVKGDVSKCQVVSLDPAIDLEALRGPFVHHPREPKRGVLEHIAVGRGTPEWVKSERIPAIVKLAAWVTEDRRWTEHGGVRWDLVERALKLDLEYGRFVYGGSTITQQLVKNLYLTRGKNLARKLEEMIIAWQMERTLTKDEILTTYINCIEYGPDIYGIKAAAKHYFDKKVQDLDAIEAAFIMGLKPYPSAGYKQWLSGELDHWWIKRVSHVLDIMASFGPELITDDEAKGFAPYQPAFRVP